MSQVSAVQGRSRKLIKILRNVKQKAVRTFFIPFSLLVFTPVTIPLPIRAQRATQGRTARSLATQFRINAGLIRAWEQQFSEMVRSSTLSSD